MFEGIADSGYTDGLLEFLSWHPCDTAPAASTADLNVAGVNASVPFAIIFYRDFCDDLIAKLNCPCNNSIPDPVACLGDQGVKFVSEVFIPERVPRAARARSRRARLIRGKASEPSDGDGDGPGRCDLVLFTRWISPAHGVGLEIAGQLSRLKYRCSPALFSERWQDRACGSHKPQPQQRERHRRRRHAAPCPVVGSTPRYAP